MKIWVSGNDVIEKNSNEETEKELYVNGYPAKLSEFIARREAALRDEDERRQMRQAKLLAARRRTEEEEEEENQPQ